MPAQGARTDDQDLEAVELMPSRKRPRLPKAGPFVPPRTFPSCYAMMLLLFEALEEFAPEVIRSLEQDVLGTTPEHLRPLTTGNATRHWSESFERWQRCFNLDRWETEEHALSFEFVADLHLVGMETSRRSNTDRAWSNWKSILTVVVAPESTAFPEWRVLEAADPGLVESLMIEPPMPEPWNPVLEPWKPWKERTVQALTRYRKDVEQAFRKAGAEPRKTKRKAREHFEWLVRYQVLEQKFQAIADAIDQAQDAPGDDPEARVRKAVQETAKLIGLHLRRGRGRPSASHGPRS